MLVSKIKPCTCKFKRESTARLRMAQQSAITTSSSFSLTIASLLLPPTSLPPLKEVLHAHKNSHCDNNNKPTVFFIITTFWITLANLELIHALTKDTLLCPTSIYYKEGLNLPPHSKCYEKEGGITK
jgi:hypothetical protein